MTDLKRIGTAAVVFLVLLRMTIGWQFLYEGLWKIESRQTAQPWSAAGYLKNAAGPFRGLFRNMAGDPDDLNLLDYEKVAADWETWQDRFVDHYPNLSEGQKARLDELLNGRKEYVAELKQLPAGVEFRGSVGRVVKYDAKRRQLIVDGQLHLLPEERDALLRMVKVEPDPPEERRAQNDVAKAYHQAVNDVYKRSSTGLGYKEKLAALLKGDPERLGAAYVEKSGRVFEITKNEAVKDALSKEGKSILEERSGKTALYKNLLQRYEESLARAKQDFQYAHLNRQGEEIQALRAELVGPVKALDDELKAKARELLSPSQLAYGPVPEPWTPIAVVDAMTIGSLTILGILLIVGLASRAAAVMGAGMLLMFYLAAPPWPGVPEMAGPEHSFIVNKNLIEAVALLAIAAMPTGTWFGIDGAFRALWVRLRNRKSDQTPLPQTAPSTGSSPAEKSPTTVKPAKLPEPSKR